LGRTDVGQHNDAVLCELGVSDGQLATLREQCVIGERALGA
jgi:crotonobetainyl-CoA:carnitine CoA-transferase CaiB-like acyl-CoA transferase